MDNEYPKFVDNGNKIDKVASLLGCYKTFRRSAACFLNVLCTNIYVVMREIFLEGRCLP